ncbi:MAG TPA: type IV secretion system protein, partial [Sphingomonas sp.]|nr:type IV secretion system protein [Sphingomonas sp.]
MIGRCPAPSLADPAMRALLDSVDCNARSFSEAGYLALGGPHAILPSALTILLTLYVALIGYRLLFGVGGARLSDAPLIAIKIGVVLTLATGWASFQTLVFDTANEAPAELARTLAAPARIGNPVAGVQAAHDAIIAAATRPADSAPGAAARPAADA